MAGQVGGLLDTLRANRLDNPVDIETTRGYLCCCMGQQADTWVFREAHATAVGLTTFYRADICYRQKQPARTLRSDARSGARSGAFGGHFQQLFRTGKSGRRTPNF